MAIVSYIVLLIRHKSSYWSKQGVKGPSIGVAVSGIIKAFKKPLHEVQREAYLKYGKVYGGYEFSLNPIVVVADPEILKDIMIKDFHIFPNRRAFASEDEIAAKFVSELWGEEWRRVRHIVTPTFTSGKMRKMFSIMNQCVDDTIGYLKELTSGGKVAKVELRKVFGAYTMDVIGRCCFATKVDAYRNPNNQFATNVRRVFEPRLMFLIIFLVLPRKLSQMLGMRMIPKEVNDYFIEATKHLIQERKSNGIKANDFLQLLIDAKHENATQDDDDDPNELHKPHKLQDGNNNNSLSKGQLTDEEITAQTMIFFGAGYETTAILLQHLFYELGKSEGMQQELLTEIKTLDKIDYNSVNSLPLLDSIISEALRFYPPATITERLADADYVIRSKDGQTIKVEKGTVITIPIYAMHHDEDNFENPQVFDPKRFLPENRHKIHPCAYLPFGQGNRNCIGMRFALLEAKVIICRLMLDFKFTAVIQELKYKPGNGLLHPESVEVSVEDRK